MMAAPIKSFVAPVMLPMIRANMNFATPQAAESHVPVATRG
jgi:hypothetical protein